ncbi:MAG: hypothetical protein J0I77_02000 [Rudaea sp.]|uniref:hypothetical protein n=1 Tax=unclassified Rudaea TaxID=2627037 RepID=UPI0010F8A32B|nr:MULTISPECIES: hypothetical protein [unclassified Rudaea]MBN8884468.1 hypothetical protein [Rudaea sp.]
MYRLLNEMLEAHDRFRGSVMDQLGGIVVVIAFVALGPQFGVPGLIAAGVMAVVGLLTLPSMVVGAVEAIRERNDV